MTDENEAGASLHGSQSASDVWPVRPAPQEQKDTR